uniref:Uncharacterized protein n=1 Tax=Triticum urartu TaxID=4572 RepID=A0A8R7Q9G9_TRIUA
MVSPSCFPRCCLVWAMDLTGRSVPFSLFWGAAATTSCIPRRTGTRRCSSSPAGTATTRRSQTTTVSTGTWCTTALESSPRCSRTSQVTQPFPAPRKSAAPSVAMAKLSSSRPPREGRRG